MRSQRKLLKSVRSKINYEVIFCNFQSVILVGCLFSHNFLLYIHKVFEDHQHVIICYYKHSFQNSIMKSSESSFPFRLKSLESLIQTSELKIRDKTQGFDQGSILKHYQQLRERQKQGLSKINMSKQRKQQLFNIPKSKSSNQRIFEKNFVILDHPLRGKTVMGKSKWENIMQTQQEQQQQLVTSIFEELKPPQVEQMSEEDLHFTTPEVINQGQIKEQEQQSQRQSQNDRLNFQSMQEQQNQTK